MDTGSDTEKEPRTSAWLLRRFAVGSDGKAFSELVGRHAAMVRGVALRCTGDAALADEVAQSVFTLLARRAASVPAEHLGGWLHNTAFLTASNARRRSLRYRKALEELSHHTIADMEPSGTDPAFHGSPWEDIRPHLDEAVSRLPEKARRPVILRFFESMSVREIAALTGRSEKAVGKALERSLQRLSGILRRRGITTTGAALAAMLSADCLLAPPASAAVMAAAALQGASSVTAISATAAGGSLPFKTIIAMTTARTVTTAGVAVILALAPAAYFWRETTALRREVLELRTGSHWLASAAVRSASEAGHATGPAGAGNEAGIGKAGGEPGSERMEALAAEFRNVWKKGNITAEVSVMTGAGRLSAEEFGPLMALLDAKKTRATFSEGNNASRGLIKLLAQCWAMVDSKAALSFTMERPEFKADEGLMASIVGELAKTDLQGAKTAVRRLDKVAREAGGREVVRILVRKDIRAALGYARELADAQAEAGVLQQMAVTDPLGAAAELVPGRDAHLPVVGSIAAALLARDRTAFETWAGTLDDPRQRAAARCVLLTKDADNDPAQAGSGLRKWLMEEPESSRLAEDVAELIAENLIRDQTPPATMGDWAAGLPEGEARDMAIVRTGRAWLEQDATAASAWLASLPPGFGRDTAVLHLVGKISGDTPADAFEWARTVQSPDERANALNDAVQAWSRQDPAAAEQALETLPAKDRVRLRDIVEAAKEQREKATER